MVKEPFFRTRGVYARPSILKEKTEEAKRHLRYSDKPVTAIGSYLGFSSPSYFSRVFRSYVRITPSEYRQQCGSLQ